MANKLKYTPAQDKLILKLLDEHKSYRDIAKIFTENYGKDYNKNMIIGRVYRIKNKKYGEIIEKNRKSGYIKMSYEEFISWLHS